MSKAYTHASCIVHHALNSILAVMLVLVVSACGDSEIDVLKTNGNANHGMKINEMKFSPDYKTIKVGIDVISNLGGYALSDTTNLKIDIKENLWSMEFLQEGMEPKLTHIENVIGKEISKTNFKMVVLVDLTLPQSLVDDERKAVEEINRTFSGNELYVAFMYANKTTPCIQLSPYILANYFVSHPNSGKYLYRSIIEKRNEMTRGSRGFTPTDNMALTIFSDGNVYNGDEPIDPLHFDMQEELSKKYTQLVKDTLSLFYVNFDNSLSGETNEAASTMQMVTKNYDGIYQDSFDWTQLEADIKRAFHLNYCDYHLTLTNPDKKIYKGQRRTVTIKVSDLNGNVLASDLFTFSLGSPYDPIVVNGASMARILTQGFLLALLALILVYLAFQLLIPWIKWKQFERKYVAEYTGVGMSIADVLVADSCYLCKDKFEKGDVIVGKCAHTMHLDCWQANEYHCPEYGAHCSEGKHYYNTVNLFDYRNASYYMVWALVAIAAGTLTWIVFTLGSHFHFSAPFYYIIEEIGNHQTNANVQYDYQFTQVPLFGLCTGFFFTLLFCLISIRSNMWAKSAVSIALRSLVSGIGSYIIFFIECIISLSFNMVDYSLLIDWIPWSLSSLLIVASATFKTRIKTRKLYVIGSMLAGLLSMYIWQFFSNGSITDYRILLLYSFIIYAVSLAHCIARYEPSSEHYFLSISGGVKPIDVALYKWFRASPHANVTIGKSIDCELQMSWEVNSDVSPLQAEIRLEGGTPKLYALEAGVTYEGAPLPVGKGVRLSHGTTFEIGRTTFTYIEKDI